MTGSEALGWRSVADLLGDHPDAPVALIGAPLNERSLTPGRCDLGPKALRAVLPRLSAYDLETEIELDVRVHDAGDVPLKAVSPADAFEPVRDAVAAQAHRALTILIGGNNAITRPAAHALGLERVGVLTLDAHFDLRDTDHGLTNGNPIQALLDDGLDGRRISQVGLAPFANTRRAHEKAMAAGISVRTARQCRDQGLAAVVAQELERLSGLCDLIHVDFDIDVIDRSQWPASPGARPGGVSAQAFFDAARVIGAHPKVRGVDLTEYDPSLEVGDLGSLTAGRWFCEILAGVQAR
ncbi:MULTISPECIES: agmatinase family protein [Brevundimonas]|uniref:Formiminoglutamase n=1 Tax=Brevundimonas abyssalis TAR-001 TaxID=1391729 RepID=A0A8E0NCB2_9CAUL|nr:MULTISPECIES: agmatinase family protein [Brevundimonas]GAD59716.1 formiminoglutamase [Brevundimonas abyssalis TAR-001]